MSDPGGRFVHAHLSHPGAVRPANEDSYLVRADEGLWVVADGMGGFEDGRWASRVVVGRLAEAVLSGDVERDAAAAAEAIRHANFLIFKESAAKRNRIGSTVAALVIAGSRFTALWAGDSRIYLFRRGSLTPLTRDHTQVRQLVDSGYLSPEEAAHHPMGHVLARAVGVHTEIEVEQAGGDVEAGDLYLLCSDGLSSVASDQEIAERLHGAHPAQIAERLLELALAKGGPDNITILAVGCGDGPASDGRAPSAPVLGGAAGEADDAAAPAPAVAAPARRAGPSGAALAMVAIAAVVLVCAGLAFILTRPHPHQTAAANAPGGPTADVVAERARAPLEAALGGQDCSWLELSKLVAGPSGLELGVSGVAASAATVQSALAQAAASAKLQIADIDLQAIAPTPPALCPTLNALRPFRAAGSAAGQSLTAAQDTFAVMKQADGPQVGRAIVTVSVPASDFALVQLNSTGAANVVAANRAAFAALANGGTASKLPQADSYRLQVDYAKPGWASLILVSGQGPFAPNLVAPGATARSADWSTQFANAAKAQGWRVEMAWYQILPGQGLSVAPPPPPTAAPIPAPTAPGALSGAPPAAGTVPAKPGKPAAPALGGSPKTPPASATPPPPSDPSGA